MGVGAAKGQTANNLFNIREADPEDFVQDFLGHLEFQSNWITHVEMPTQQGLIKAMNEIG